MFQGTRAQNWVAQPTWFQSVAQYPRMEPGSVLDRSGKQRKPAIQLGGLYPGAAGRFDRYSCFRNGWTTSVSRPAERTSRLQRPRGVLAKVLVAIWHV